MGAPAFFIDTKCLAVVQGMSTWYQTKVPPGSFFCMISEIRASGGVCRYAALITRNCIRRGF